MKEFTEETKAYARRLLEKYGCNNDQYKNATITQVVFDLQSCEELQEKKPPCTIDELALCIIELTGGTNVKRRQTCCNCGEEICEEDKAWRVYIGKKASGTPMYEILCSKRCAEALKNRIAEHYKCQYWDILNQEYQIMKLKEMPQEG